jgi:DoxX-like protein
MHSNNRAPGGSNKGIWDGRIITALVVAFLLFDSSIKLMKLRPAVQGTMRLGYPERLVPIIGILLLVCVVFYVVPRTAVLGAILLKGYLGGAVASSVRVEHPLWYDLLPLAVAALMWVGLYLRDGDARAHSAAKSLSSGDSAGKRFRMISCISFNKN